MQLADDVVDSGVGHRIRRRRVLRVVALVLAQTVEDYVAPLVAVLDEFVLEDVDEAVRVTNPLHDLVPQRHLVHDRLRHLQLLIAESGRVLGVREQVRVDFADHIDLRLSP